MYHRILIVASSVALLGLGAAAVSTHTGTATRTVILTEAESNYSYGPERAAVSVDSKLVPGPGGVLPTITISTATQKNKDGRFPKNHFVYRLTSSGAYPTMGIAPGENFVWRDTSSTSEGPYRTLVVPKDTAYPMVWLRQDSVGQYVPGPTPEPRLVKSTLAYGVCDHNCSPHCVSRSALRNFTPSDTLKVTFRR